MTGQLCMDRPLSVGFGSVTVMCNGTAVWSGNDAELTVFDFEKRAKSGEDWRIEFCGPLLEEHFRRVVSYDWEQTFHGDGFA